LMSHVSLHIKLKSSILQIWILNPEVLTISKLPADLPRPPTAPNIWTSCGCLRQNKVSFTAQDLRVRQSTDEKNVLVEILLKKPAVSYCCFGVGKGEPGLGMNAVSAVMAALNSDD
jgi:hypothetical protein